MSSQKAKQKMANEKYPAIPSKLYFTIGEASELCLVKPHVLRYWEQEFTQLSPSKRRGNRRYYQHSDITLVRSIKDLLYNRGYTIEGAKTQLSRPAKIEPQKIDREIEEAVASLESLLGELEEA
jgi:DNA-binding transcriptional MerR regulator